MTFRYIHDNNGFTLIATVFFVTVILMMMTGWILFISNETKLFLGMAHREHAQNLAQEGEEKALYSLQKSVQIHVIPHHNKQKDDENTEEPKEVVIEHTCDEIGGIIVKTPSLEGGYETRGATSSAYVIALTSGSSIQPKDWLLKQEEDKIMKLKSLLDDGNLLMHSTAYLGAFDDPRFNYALSSKTQFIESFDNRPLRQKALRDPAAITLDKTHLLWPTASVLPSPFIAKLTLDGFWDYDEDTHPKRAIDIKPTPLITLTTMSRFADTPYASTLRVTETRHEAYYLFVSTENAYFIKQKNDWVLQGIFLADWNTSKGLSLEKIRVNWTPSDSTQQVKEIKLTGRVYPDKPTDPNLFSGDLATITLVFLNPADIKTHKHRKHSQGYVHKHKHSHSDGTTHTHMHYHPGSDGKFEKDAEPHSHLLADHHPDPHTTLHLHYTLKNRKLRIVFNKEFTPDSVSLYFYFSDGSAYETTVTNFSN